MNLITEILKLWLDREPTYEDFKDCSKLYQINENNKYILAHKKQRLGTIEWTYPDIDNNLKTEILFTPINDKSNNLQ